MDELINCLKIITNPSDGLPGSLGKALSDLDALVDDPSLNLHPRLVHFLQNRSYQKAITWIEGGEPEKGICGK